MLNTVDFHCDANSIGSFSVTRHPDESYEDEEGYRAIAKMSEFLSMRPLIKQGELYVRTELMDIHLANMAAHDISIAEARLPRTRARTLILDIATTSFVLHSDFEQVIKKCPHVHMAGLETR